MPETTAPATELTSQYVAQVTGDLERNIKEQERISAEIASLQEQLGALQHDHTVLVNMQQALGIAKTPAGRRQRPTAPRYPPPGAKPAPPAAGSRGHARPPPPRRKGQ